jgi:predicted transposase/invertase (TIGR01784 family)
MQRLDRDPDVQRKIDELVREFAWDKKWKAEGKLEGKLERTLEIALHMLSKGMPLEDISDITGLPLNKLKEMKND